MDYTNFFNYFVIQAITTYTYTIQYMSKLVLEITFSISGKQKRYAEFSHFVTARNIMIMSICCKRIQGHYVKRGRFLPGMVYPSDY